MHHQSLQVWSQVGWVDNGHSFNVKHLAACLHASSSDSRFLLCLIQVQKHESVSLQQLQAWLTSHRWNMQQTQHLGWKQSRVKWVDERHGLKCMRVGTQTGVHGGMHTCVSVTVPLACLPVARCFPNQVLSTSATLALLLAGAQVTAVGYAALPDTAMCLRGIAVCKAHHAAGPHAVLSAAGKDEDAAARLVRVPAQTCCSRAMVLLASIQLWPRLEQSCSEQLVQAEFGVSEPPGRRIKVPSRRSGREGNQEVR